jgi:hypothetical protein
MLNVIKSVPEVFMIRIARAEKFTVLVISKRSSLTLILGSEENRNLAGVDYGRF